jgi:hypothetical protein
MDGYPRPPYGGPDRIPPTGRLTVNQWPQAVDHDDVSTVRPREAQDEDNSAIPFRRDAKYPEGFTLRIGIDETPGSIDSAMCPDGCHHDPGTRDTPLSP